MAAQTLEAKLRRMHASLAARYAQGYHSTVDLGTMVKRLDAMLKAEDAKRLALRAKFLAAFGEEALRAYEASPAPVFSPPLDAEAAFAAFISQMGEEGNLK